MRNEEGYIMKLSFKDLVKTRKGFVGTFIQSTSEEMVEIIGYSGFEFVIIDTEHGPFGIETASRLLRAAEATDTISTIRVQDNSEMSILKALDLGVSGIVVPGISSVEDAQKAIKFAKFRPLGTRGACPCVRSNKYGLGDSSYYEESNESTSIILLLEGKKGIESIDEILKLNNIDAILLGPVDLSHSLDVPDDFNHPVVIDTITEAINKGRKAGICIGVFSTDTNIAKKNG